MPIGHAPFHRVGCLQIRERESVHAVREQVQLVADVFSAQSRLEQQRVLDRNGRVRQGVPQKCTRHARGNQRFQRKSPLFRSIFTCQTHKAAAVCIRSRRDHRIAQHGRIRSVRLQIRARGKPVCVMPRRRQQSRQMGARRKSADRNAVCRDAELCRMFSHPGDRRGQRVQRLYAKRHLRAVVLEHERFHTFPRKRTRDRCALPNGAVFVAAARAQDERRLISSG